jgi:EF hand
LFDLPDASKSHRQFHPPAIMKSTTFITFSAFIGACSLASAQAEPTPSKPKLPAALLETFDTNKDGTLSDDEKNAMKAAMQAKSEERKAAILAKYDKDKDGKLSDDEKATLKAEMDAKRTALIAKYDANKDGKLNPAEMKAAREAGEEMPTFGRGGQGVPPVPAIPAAPAPAPSPE